MGDAVLPNSIDASARRSAIRTLTIRRMKIFWLDLLNL